MLHTNFDVIILLRDIHKSTNILEFSTCVLNSFQTLREFLVKNITQTREI